MKKLFVLIAVISLLAVSLAMAKGGVLYINVLH